MRAKNIQALTEDIQRRYPGVTIYGVGDEAHQGRISDHNEDDTPGSKPAQQDADNIPEHRAIDVMLGSAFNRAAADLLVANLVADPAARVRLYYIIFNGFIWSRSNGWQKKVYSGTDQHRGHVHISGYAADDENDSPWPAVDREKPPATVAPSPDVYQFGDEGDTVRHIQMFLRNTFPSYRDYVLYKRGQLLEVDGDFGRQTEAWVKEFQRRTGLKQDGIVGPKTFSKMRQYGYKY